MPTPPLAERMRPQQLNDVVGQQHLVGPGAILRTAVECGYIPSLIFWGPPGTGKTSLAGVIAHTLGLPFFTLSAISSGVKEVREAIGKAQELAGAVLFIDEIHRFNKGQQDALLGAVEKGIITLIGATTENPSFEVNSALLSRCQVYVLKPLREEDLLLLLYRAMEKDVVLRNKKIELKETAALLRISGGDARRLLNLFELVTSPPGPLSSGAVEGEREPSLASATPAPNLLERGPGGEVVITDELVQRIAQQRIALYDKSGEQHYDIISAFIKSMRGSDPNGAVYWLARMIGGGEDVKFIARRMVIFASEDVGNANPNALLLANATFDAVHKIGHPEARIILAQCATYLASSPKSNRSYIAINEAMAAVAKSGDLSVPLHLRNAPTGLMKEMGYGKEYQYAHDFDNNFADQEYLPDALSGTVFYTPGPTAREEELRKFLKSRWGNKYGY